MAWSGEAAQSQPQQDRAPRRTLQPISWDYMPKTQNELPFVLLVEGTPGQGKTHLSYTFPEPIFHVDTEVRGDRVGYKFRAQGKEIYWKKVKSLKDIERVLGELIYPNFTHGTIIIDSASDLQTWAEDEFLAETKNTKVWPITLWPLVWDKINPIINSMKERGFNVVFTARRKGEYIDDKASGSLVMEGYKKLPYFADIHILLENGVAKVLKNGFRNTPVEKTLLLDNPSYDSIRQKLIVETSPKETFDSTPEEKPVEQTQPQEIQQSDNNGFLATLDLDSDLDNEAEKAFPEGDESVLLRSACLAIVDSIGKDTAWLNRVLSSKSMPKFEELSKEELTRCHDYLIRYRDKNKKAEG